MVLGGDIDREQVEPLVRKYFGAIPKKDIPEREPLNLKPLKKNQRLDSFKSDQIDVPAIMRRYRVSASSSSDSLIKEVIFTLLQTVPLDLDVNFRLVLGQGYLGLSQCLESSSCSKKKLKKAEKEFEKALIKFARKGIKSKDLEKAKNMIRNAYFYRVDNVTTSVEILGSSLSTGKTLDEIENYIDVLNSISKKQVKKVLREILDTDKHLTTWLLPSKKSPKGNEDDADY